MSEMNDCKESVRVGENSHQYEPEQQIKRQQKRNWLGIKATNSKYIQVEERLTDCKNRGKGGGGLVRTGSPAMTRSVVPQDQSCLTSTFKVASKVLL